MASRNIKFGFIADDTTQIPGRLRTAREARQSLEDLRNDYQLLAPKEQHAVKSFMSDLLESQRRFGSVAKLQD